MQTADDEAVDRRLIARVVSDDDHGAFAELVRRHQSPVRQFLRRLTRTDPDGARSDGADDYAQETFFAAYRGLARFRGDGRFRSWLFGIAYQQVVGGRRRRGRWHKMTLASSVNVSDEMAAPSDAQRIVARRTVDGLLAKLRPDERAAILLHYQHGMTHPEVASALGIPLGTVKTLIRRGRIHMNAVSTP